MQVAENGTGVTVEAKLSWLLVDNQERYSCPVVERYVFDKDNHLR